MVKFKMELIIKLTFKGRKMVDAAERKGTKDQRTSGPVSDDREIKRLEGRGARQKDEEKTRCLKDILWTARARKQRSGGGQARIDGFGSPHNLQIEKGSWVKRTRRRRRRATQRRRVFTKWQSPGRRRLPLMDQRSLCFGLEIDQP